MGREGAVDLRRGKSASVLPLFTGLISKEKARRLVEEHVLSDEVFWTPLSLELRLVERRPGTRRVEACVATHALAWRYMDKHELAGSRRTPRSCFSSSSLTRRLSRWISSSSV